MRLPRNDIVRFLKDPSQEIRHEVLVRILDQYNCAEDGRLSADDMALVEALLRHIAKHAKVPLRKAVADRVDATPHLPKDIAVALAKDLPEIALPILRHSPCLPEDALLEIITATSKPDRLLAIAQRMHLSEALTAALLAKRNNAVTHAVLGSFGSAISEAAYADILANPKVTRKIMQAMVEKGSLPLNITQQLFAQLTGKARESLNDDYEVVFQRKNFKTEMEQKKRRAAEEMKKLQRAAPPQKDSPHG